MSFIHLHTHSEYSWLDGACTIDDLVQSAVRLKLPAVATTDRNSVAGASRLWHLCIKAGIKPIVGLEIEVLNDSTDSRAFSVILIAKNGDGLAKLCRLVTLAYEYDAQIPRITKSQLAQQAGDLICLSFSVVGELCTLLLEGRDDEARQASDWYHSVFGEDYYYEIQNHGLPKEAIAMNKLLNLAYRTKIPVVLTNDCHYMERRDSLAIDALNCIRKGITFSHPEAKRFACNEYYFKAPKVMQALYSFPPQLIKNTIDIARQIDVMGGFLPVADSDLDVEKVVQILRNFSRSIGISYRPGDRQIKIYLRGASSSSVMEHLRSNLPDFELLPWTEYQRWTPAHIYRAVLEALQVEDRKIRELCGLIPYEARTLEEAVLIDTEFSCLYSEDYVCAQALEIADSLINTFAEASAVQHCYAVIPKDMPVPIVRDMDGNPRCQYEFQALAEAGVISLEFQI